MTESKAKERIEELIRDIKIIPSEERIRKLLQEQAKEIKKGLEQNNLGLDLIVKWDKFWEKYTGKEEEKDARR